MHLHKLSARALILVIVAVLAITILAPVSSFASSEGRRNTAIGLAGVAAFLLASGKTVPGLIAAAGSGYAFNRYNQERREDFYRGGYHYKRGRTWSRDRDWSRDRYHSNYGGGHWDRGWSHR